MKKIYAVYGASGFGREVMPLLKKAIIKLGEPVESLYFVDDACKNNSLNDYQFCNFESFLNLPAEERYISIAIANSRIRKILAAKCEQNKIKFMNIIASNVIIMDDVTIGESPILSPFVTLTSNIKIGKSFHANIYSYVAHDCRIGDFVTFAPSVKCNGNVEIGDNVYVGTGAIIKQGKPGNPIKIGKNAVISAGAFVTKNVPDGTTVFGNPAIKLTKENLRKRNG